ncbi:MAG: neuraminidase-like domain-containing protein [Nitrospira sp.]
MQPVNFPLKLQMKRPEVGDLHQALSTLGFAIAAAEKKNQRFGVSTRAAAREFQAAHKLRQTGAVDQATAKAINQELTDRGVLTEPLPGGDTPGPNPPTNPPEVEQPSAHGTVTHTDGTAINGVKVRAFHRQLAGELELGETASNDRGQYTIHYEYPTGTSRVDLFVRAYGETNTILAVSPLLVGVRGKQVVDLVVEAERYRGPSEFERASAALNSQIRDVDLDTFDANDVAFLVRTMKLSREMVTAWITSRQLAVRFAVEQEVLYGLIRVENTASFPKLLRRSRARLIRALTQAAQTNLISLVVGEQARETVTRLQQVAINLSASNDTPGSLGLLLGASTVSAPQQRVFLERYAKHEGPISAFWRALREDQTFGNAAVDELQLTIQLGTLTANHAPLAAVLRARGIRRGSETATLTREDWRTILRGQVAGKAVGTPANIKGATQEERINNYITLLLERTALAFPTTKVTQTLKTIPNWQASSARAFLDANPDFNLLTRNIDTAMKSSTSVIRPEWDRESLASELATVQRVARLAPKGRHETVVNGLLTAGYHSALSILRQSRVTFLQKTAQTLGGKSAAEEVYRNAQFQMSRVVTAFSLMHPRLAEPMARAVGTISKKVSEDATWSSLFGNVDYCQCNHCRSIYSPAAYLVDLLAWLDTHELNGRTAFERLDARRPDIKRIELSCDNTNTVLPYVDLVTEILEDRILSFPTVDGTQVPIASTATSAELLAHPESLHPAVYDQHLAKEVYPWLLPFDLWGELGRVYFEHLGVRRSDLMEALARPDVPGRSAISAERLGMSSAQWKIVTGADSRPVWKFWGYGSENPKGTNFKADLAVVSNFLRRADCEYDELLDLLHSRVANQNKIVIVGEACDTDELTLETLSDTDLDRMQRFLRLWRNRGWSILNLDKVLYALNPVDINAKSLHALADLERIQSLTKAPLLDISCWWATIDTFEDRPEKDQPVKSLYQQVFLNRAVDPAAEEDSFPLALNPIRTALLRSDVSWDSIRSHLLAALRVDDAELSLLVDETIDDLPNPHRVVTGANATLEGLSALYRHVSLARTLKLTVTDLLGVLELTSLDPFTLEKTGDTVELIDTLSEIRASGFSLDELHYLHEHDLDADTRVGVTDEAISQTLVEIRDGLTAIQNEFVIVADPNGDVTMRYLGMVLEADAAAAVLAALQTEGDGTNNSELAQILIDHLGSVVTFDAESVIAQSIELRYNSMVGLLVPYLKDLQSKALVIEKTATFTRRDLDSIEDLLALRVTMTVQGSQLSALIGLQQSPYIDTEGTELTIEADGEAFATLRRLFKICLVLNKLEVDIDEQLWLFDVGVSKRLLNPVSLPTEPQSITADTWGAWTRLVDLFSLRKGLPGGEPSLAELLRLFEFEGDATAAESTFETELSARTGWLVDDISTLVTAFGLRFPQDWFDGQALKRLVDAFKLIRRIGVDAVQADHWATADIDMAQAESLRLAGKAKHDETQWPAIARGLRDPVREKQRAALVGYLIGQLPKYRTESDLFNDLLIDVEMAPCMLTSRIKQAISSVQLFVQRGFLNLEDGVEFTRTDREEWEWRKTYRVWEANRKVFLHPENWIEPDLRSNKSELFEQLESSLLQGEVTDVSVEKAYTAYLEGLLKIGRLEVMGIYHQEEEEDADGRVDILHVVARTKGHPREYYYRQWIDEREWTPWEKLDTDIDAEHVILAVWDRRLYVFWPMVVQKAEAILANDPDEAPESRNFFEMKLAWIERLNDRWGGRKLTENALLVNGKWDELDWTATSEGGYSFGETPTYFRLAQANTLVIECRQSLIPPVGSILGKFVLDPCTGSMVVENTTVPGTEIVTPTNNVVSRMRMTCFDQGDLSADAPLRLMTGSVDQDGRLSGSPQEIDVLGKVAPYPVASFAYPHQYGEFASQHGVFLDDDERTFHVIPEQVIDLGHYFDEEYKDELDPGDVGVIISHHELFEDEPRPPKFEPELPWDSDVLNEESPGPRQRVTELRANTSGPFNSLDALSSLTDQQLQYSQNQLFEAKTISDPYGRQLSTKYRFSLFYHPYVCDFMTELRRFGVAGLLDPNPFGSPAARDLVRQEKALDFFKPTYQPTASVLNTPIQDIDFEFGGAYADYNWEIFFHAPFLIANRLSQNQRFEEARRWYHFIFDPTNRSDDKDPLRFWKMKPFYREADAPIDEFLKLASSTETTPETIAAREQYDDQVQAWLANPFDPHAIARLRTTAYQKTLVMKYLDNLIAWGDSLFRQDTIESINEAIQLYVLALDLLGERPDALPPRAIPVAKTFEQVRQDLDDSVLNNPLNQNNPFVRLENLLFNPKTNDAPWRSTWPLPLPLNYTIFNGGAKSSSLYFCIPPNDKLLGYWDTVEDRLFKIRHCMSIEGIVRQLPLFEPPIDPGMLVRARAAGVDLVSALADLNAPLPHYRFNVMLQKAYAFNQTVRGLGGALLSALEKKDAEELAALRSTQEVALLETIREVKKLAVEEAQHTLVAAERSLTVIEQRRDYYQGLITNRRLEEEKQQVKMLRRSRDSQLAAAALAFIGSSVSPIPAITTGASGAMGTPVATATVTDGQGLAKGFDLLGQAASLIAAQFSADATLSGLAAGFARRNEDWEHQLTAANREIKQIEKQIEAGKVRVAMAERDLENHERQIEQAWTVREFMESKFTNVELYQWMVGQLSSLYFQSYQLAYDLGKQTERAYRHELALPESTFISFGYWDSLKKGLLAGELLQLSLERMDKSYLENNRREYELTKHVSLALLDPVALLKLQTDGTCEFSIPESLFDLEYPGHYLRRIKSVSISIPCVTGPYTSVPARLTLVSSRTRVDPSAAGDYPMVVSEGSTDQRFQFHTGAVQSIIVSAGREDSGLFMADHRDERYLPFEGSGAISDWSLALTSAVQTFDWSTITDVVIHVRYTAREGGELLREAALKSLQSELQGIPLQRSFSAMHEFPTEWNAFLRPATDAGEAVLKLDLSEKRFPYFARSLEPSISKIELVALVKGSSTWTGTDVTVEGGERTEAVTLASADNLYGGNPSGVVEYQGASPGAWTVRITTASLGPPSEWIDDLVIIATYQVTVPA